MMTFLGKDTSYWIELEKRLQIGDPKTEKLLEEVVQLRGLVNFYESRIREIAFVCCRKKEE